jgi:hypothetical protein
VSRHYTAARQGSGGHERLGSLTVKGYVISLQCVRKLGLLW